MTTQTTTTTQTPASLHPRGRRDPRAIVGMTAATLALLGSVAFWQMRPGDEAASTTPATTRTHGGQPATFVPVPDAAMCQQWLDQAAAAPRPVEPSAFSDQEMFSQWQQRMSSPAGQPASHPGS